MSVLEDHTVRKAPGVQSLVPPVHIARSNLEHPRTLALRVPLESTALVWGF